MANLISAPLRLPNCELCDNTRILPSKSGGVQDCMCIVRAKLAQYLGPEIADALYIKGLDIPSLKKRNVLIQNDMNLPDMKFFRAWRSVAKTFLIANFHPRSAPSYEVCDGTKEIIDAMFTKMRDRDGDTPVHRYDLLEAADLLILYLPGDPRNEHNSNLTGFLRTRLLNNKFTWIVSSFKMVPNDSRVENIYGRDFADYIQPLRSGGKPGVGQGDFLLLEWAPIIQELRMVSARPTAAVA